MKPASWEQLPASIRESLLWDCELEYDAYESSKAEKIHEILCGNIDGTNKQIVDTAWKFLSEDKFRIRCEMEMTALKGQLDHIIDLLDNKQ